MKIPAAVGLALWLSMQAVTPVPDDSAARVQETVDKVLAILKDPRLRGEAREQQRHEKLKTVLHERFDFAEMAKLSLGPEWNRRTAAERAEFVGLFTDLLERAYLKSINDVEQVRIVHQRVDGRYAEVETRLVDNKDVEFVVIYRLHNTGGDWKVYDVVVDHVSLVANYRAQFNRVLSRYSYEELIHRMKSRSEFSAPANKRNEMSGFTKHQAVKFTYARAWV